MNLYFKNNLLNTELILQKANLKKNAQVADFGCGSLALFVFQIAKVVEKGRVYAVDILKTALEEVKNKAKIENIKNIETIWSNLEIFKATKIESSSLDVAFLINVLYQSDKKDEILREISRMLKIKGKLIIVDWKDSALPLGPTSDKRIDINLLKKQVQNAGFKLEEEFDAGDYHFGMVLVNI